MISGTVNANLEATLPVEIEAPNGRRITVTAVIDTGYNGALTLPLAIVNSLALPRLAPRSVTLADASQRTLDHYSARVFWDGQPRVIRVLCVEGDPLLGTGLLKGYKLEASFDPGGPVIVTKLP